MNELFEAFDNLISKTDCMNNTCAHLGDCLKDGKCRYNDDNLMCPDYKMAKILYDAITELKQIKDKFDEDRKSDITNLSYNKFKEIHKDDTPEVAVDILHRLSLVPDYVKPNSVEVWARRFLRDKVDQALTELKQIKETKPSEALECIDRCCCALTLNDCYEEEYNTIKNYILKTQEQDKVLDIIKKKCLYNDNLNYAAVCINYDMYKEKMSKKHNTEVVKIDWTDRDLLDYLKLLKEEEFNLLKRWQNENIRSRN